MPIDWKVATNSSGMRATRARDSWARYTATREGHSRALGPSSAAPTGPCSSTARAPPGRTSAGTTLTSRCSPSVGSFEAVVLTGTDAAAGVLTVRVLKPSPVPCRAAPPSAGYTSSRLGVARVKSSRAAKAAPPVTVATTARASSGASRSVQRRPDSVARSRRAATSGTLSGAVSRHTRSTRTSPATFSLSPEGVSQAITRPRSRTATRSSTVSASMTLWVTSRTVVPCSARRRSTAAHTARRGHRVHAGGRLVQDEQRALPHQHGGEAGQPALPAGELLDRAGGERGQAQLVEDGVPLGARLPHLQAAQPCGGLGGERHGQLVQGTGLLPEVGEDPRGPLRVAHDVVPEDLHAAAVGPHQPGELAYEGGLAGAVRPEQSEDLTAADLQGHVVGGPHLGVAGTPRLPRTAG